MMNRICQAVEDATVLYMRAEHITIDQLDSTLNKIASTLKIIKYQLSEKEIQSIKENVLKRLERSDIV